MYKNKLYRLAESVHLNVQVNVHVIVQLVVTAISLSEKVFNTAKFAWPCTVLCLKFRKMSRNNDNELLLQYTAITFVFIVLFEMSSYYHSKIQMPVMRIHH